MILQKNIQSPKYIAHFKTLLFCACFMLFYSCDKIDTRLKVVNNTDKVLFYKWSSDSSFLNLYKNIEESRVTFKLDSVQVLRVFQKIDPRNDTITEMIFGSWENYIKESQIKYISMFLVQDSFSKKCIRSPLDVLNLVKKRKIYNVDDLRKNNWLIIITE